MPVKKCVANGKPGFKWGDKGRCYTYTQGNSASKSSARHKAEKQGKAIKANSRKI